MFVWFLFNYTIMARAARLDATYSDYCFKLRMYVIHNVGSLQFISAYLVDHTTVYTVKTRIFNV